MRNVPTDDNRSVERQTCGNGVFIQLFENFAHRLVEVYFNGVAFTGLAEFFGNELAGVTVEFLDPNTVLVDFTFDVSVGRAAHSQSYRAGGSVAGQTDNAYVVCQIFTAELCAESDTVRFFQDLFFQLDVTECSSEFVSGRGQTIVVVGGCQFHGEQVFLGRSPADDECNVIGRTGCRTQCFHFFHQERNECPGVENGFRFLVEVCLIRRSTAFGDAEEFILHTFGSFQVDLCGKITFGIYFVVHGKGRVLGVAQVFLGIGFVNAEGESFFIAISRPDLLAFLSVNDCRTGVLTERKYSFGGHFGIAEEGERYVFIVFAGFGIAQNLSYLFVVRTAKHKRYIAEGGVRHSGKTFLFDFQDGFPFELAYRYIIFREQIILGRVFAEREHGLILKRCDSHSYMLFSMFCLTMGRPNEV